jgi:elongation factor 3
MAPVVPVMLVDGTAPPPSQDEINDILHTVFTSDKAQTSLDASYALSTLLLSSVGFRGLKSYGVLDAIRKAATDKKNAAGREGAMFALGALFERMPPKDATSEIVFLLQDENAVPLALDALADKVSTTKESAQYALDTLFDNLKPEALVVGLLPVLAKYLSKSTGKWQGTVGALALIGRMADKAKMGTGSREEEATKDVLREAVGKKLEGLIPVVESGMHDLKAEVTKQANKAMLSLTTLLQNDDVAPRIPVIIAAMEKPSSQTLDKAIHALSQTTFVAEVTSPVLALLTPLLERSLNTPTTTQEVLRRTVIVIENLTKLVHDPIEARAFLPKLKPGVKSVKQNASLPEVREIADRAWNVMEKAMGESNGTTEKAISRTSVEDVSKKLDEVVKKHGGLRDANGDAAIWNLTKSYVSQMVAEDVNQRQLDRVKACIEPYLRHLLVKDSASAVAGEAHKSYVDEDNRKFGAPITADEGEVEIVNANFSLGYGGMLLLSHTNLRLLKGHRYGLCGRNGAGKSTLMRSISEGKLEGFPSPDEVRTCFVEHNQGEDADLSILEYCCKDPKLAPEGREMRADVLLLDEPTNHLDFGNVKWLEDYLKKHTEITSLIVSHDSSFLDEVCTDIYHYENKKLVLYKGNLAEFVKVKPEAKTYYTLSNTNAQWKFPPPGILTGVKSNTRAILRMTNCTFTYPNAPKPSLYDVSCHLSLSSRVAIIGPNGAGKSTLIKILTGEVIPQEGKVEKHPNLRIGYIKQHALEHVEMHMEKTPNQYLQWRYANGDDREVLMKQTRIMTDEDRAQMEKPINLKDGRGDRWIEALIGRQKYQKSFQYEVKWKNMLPKFNTMISRETLLKLEFYKLVQEFDDHEASREGLGYRILEPKEISKHFEDVGMDPEIANHNQISGLSGGQKVKVVLAGAMWNNPYVSNSSPFSKSLLTYY